MIMCLQSLVSFCQFVLKILSKTQILTSIKGRNSVANLRKTMKYNTIFDLVNNNVYTKFGVFGFQESAQFNMEFGIVAYIFCHCWHTSRRILLRVVMELSNGDVVSTCSPPD